MNGYFYAGIIGCFDDIIVSCFCNEDGFIAEAPMLCLVFEIVKMSEALV
jgi:hypothetical protein